MPCNTDAQCHVELLCDEASYINSLNKIEKINSCIEDVFALDNKTIKLPVFYEGKDNKYLLDKESEIVYKIEEQNKAFNVISKNDNRFSRKAVMRILREIAMNHCITLGHQIIHCAALSYYGKGILIAGAKGAGKTTLLMGLLQLSDYCYIANDRAVISMDNNFPEIHGIPTIVNIKRNTLNIFPNFHDILMAGDYDYHMNTNKSDGDPTDNIQPDELGNYSINPLQFCKILNTEQKTAARLKAIIFPVIKYTKSAADINELSEHEASGLLSNSLFSSGSNLSNTQIFALNNSAIPIDNLNKNDLSYDITSRVRSFRINLGMDIFKNLSVFNSELIRALN